MLVEMKQVAGTDSWEWMDANGIMCAYIMATGVSPREAISDKQNLKTILKLKEAGFSTEDIIELNKAKML